MNHLALVPDPPPKRGRLMTAREVAEEILAGTVSSKWVLENAPNRIQLGEQTVRFFEEDMWRWVNERRSA